MWPNARLTKLFGIEHPIVLAPMAGAMDFELVAAVSAAGGLGSLPCAMLTPDALRDQLAKSAPVPIDPSTSIFSAILRRCRTTRARPAGAISSSHITRSLASILRFRCRRAIACRSMRRSAR